MGWYRVATSVLVLLLLGGAVAAAATPKVSLHLDAALVGSANGHVTMTAVGDRRLKSGDVVAYRIVAKNAGSAPALSLAPVGRVPARTSFLRIIEAPQSARAEFTLDGIHFFAHPTVTVVDKDGRKSVKPAPLSAYRAVRWTMSAPLKPSASATFVYEVRVQ